MSAHEDAMAGLAMALYDLGAVRDTYKKLDDEGNTVSAQHAKEQQLAINDVQGRLDELSWRLRELAGLG